MTEEEPGQEWSGFSAIWNKKKTSHNVENSAAKLLSTTQITVCLESLRPGLQPGPRTAPHLFGRAGQFVESSKLRLAHCWKRLQMSMRPSIKNVRRSTI